MPPVSSILSRAAALAAAASALSAQSAAVPALSRADAVAAIESLARGSVGPRLAGMVVAVVKGRDTLVHRGYGKADLEWDVPMPVDAEFQIGSVTKQFTAALILRLVEQGKLSLDDDVTKHLPTLDTRGRRIPLRRLLDHSSGLKGYTEMPSFRTLALLASPPRDTMIALLNAERPDFDAGTSLIYNNSGYFLLGLIAEKVAGATYEDLVRTELFERAGMTRTRYCSDVGVVARRAHGYQATRTGLQLAEYISQRWPYAAGSLCSTSADLLAWLDALHGGRVVSPASRTAMITPHPLADGTTPRYAMGLMVDETGGHRYVGHGGAIPGFLSETRVYPADSLTIIVLLNTTGPVSPTVLADSIATLVLGRTAPVAAKPLPKGGSGWLAGRYTGPGRGQPLTFVIEAAGDSVVARRSPTSAPARLRHLGDWRFEGPARARFTFRRGADGTPSLLFDQVATVVRLTRQAEPAAATGGNAARR